jgi:hypothetical protein
MHIAIWLIAAVALGLWSLLAWGVAAVLGMDPTWIGNMQPMVAEIPYADLIEAWIPGWQAMLVSLLHLVQAVVGWLGGAGLFVVWLLWGVGALFIAGTAAVLSLVVVLVRKSTKPTPPPPSNNTPAAA